MLDAQYDRELKITATEIARSIARREDEFILKALERTWNPAWILSPDGTIRPISFDQYYNPPIHFLSDTKFMAGKVDMAPGSRVEIIKER